MLNYAPQAPSCLTCLSAFMPSCLCALRALLTGLIYAPCTLFSRTLQGLFVCHNIFLKWICSPAETFLFPRTIKNTTNCAVFICIKKPPWNLLRREIFKAYLKSEINSMFLCFCFHLFKHEVINFLVWNNQKSKEKVSYLIFDITIMHCKYITKILSILSKNLLLLLPIIIVNGGI